MQPEKAQYTAKTHTPDSRVGGASRSDDGRLDVKGSNPGADANPNEYRLF